MVRKRGGGFARGVADRRKYNRQRPLTLYLPTWTWQGQKSAEREWKVFLHYGGNFRFREGVDNPTGYDNYSTQFAGVVERDRMSMFELQWLVTKVGMAKSSRLYYLHPSRLYSFREGLRQLKTDDDVFKMLDEYYNIESIAVMVLHPDGVCDWIVAPEANGTSTEQNLQSEVHQATTANDGCSSDLSTLSKDKVDAHVPGESSLEQMPGDNSLGPPTGSLVVSSKVSLYATANGDIIGENHQGRQHSEEQNGSCLRPDSPFIYEKRSQYASADADISHRSQCKEQTLEGNAFHVTMSSPFTSDREPIKQRTTEENGACLNQLSLVIPAKVVPNARVSVDLSHESDHDKEHTPDESGFCVTPVSLFSSHQGSLSASVNVEISHEADHGETQMTNGNALCLTPVSPFTRGQGLPYAPENMPCPGDTWSWRVGRRINRKGFFNDRYLRPPEHLQMPKIKPEGFGSKVAVEKYILSEFPQADLDEFFSSFSWLVPAEPMFGNQVVQLLNHTDTGNSKEGVPSDVPVQSISTKRKRKPESVDNAFLLTKSCRSKFEKAKGKNQQLGLEATLCVSKKRKHERRIWSDALKVYSRHPKIQLLITSETVETSHGELRSKASPMEIQSNSQSCGSRSDNNPPCIETPEAVIVAGFNEDSGSIYQEMGTVANTESNQVSSQNICTDLSLFPSHDSIAFTESIQNGGHESLAETVDFNQYINSPEDVLAQPVVVNTTSVDHQYMRIAADTESNQVSSQNICTDLIIFPSQDSIACKTSDMDGNHVSSVDQYINSLEDVHAQPLVLDTTSVENQDMRTIANTESNQVSGQNICTDLINFPRQDSIAGKTSDKDGNHVSSADQYINSLEDVHAQPLVLDTTSVENQDMRTIANTESNQVSGHKIGEDLILLRTPSYQDSVARKASVKGGNHESSAEMVNFDQYINSLDDVLAQSIAPGSTSIDTTEDMNLEKEMAEARAKLSSFFAVDFSVFVSSGMHSEFAGVLGVLSKDPNLTTNQLVQLKLLEVIPLLRTSYIEEAKAIEEAENFFEDLSIKVAKAYSCKDEYNDFKAKEEHAHEEIDSNSLHLKKIEEQIALLTLQRDEVADSISGLKAQRNSLNSQKKDIVELLLPDIVSRIQMANGRKVEWESKKLKALERQAELNAVFVSIKEKITWNRFGSKLFK